MGWPPAVVIVVRHGARLDAADKQWHLTSPTPYDPPLTYGGWTQSRALGARIANILRTRETDDEIPPANIAAEEFGRDKRKRRHKVIIHTSPFLRCVQTATAISSGLAQNPGHTHHRRPQSSHSNISSPMHASPRVRPTLAIGSPSLAPISEPANNSGKPQDQPENIKKATLRVDAFLGEWLTTDYFEHITPPPSSLMMVAGAKADLLRREDYANLIHIKDITGGGIQKGFPGGWGSPILSNDEKKDEGTLSSMSSLGQALHRRDRTSSLSNPGPNGSGRSHRSNSPLPSRAEHGIYQPPIPSYAISLSDPIPSGYVAHARDACVDIDYQWDSMRELQEWGNGGEYGEEWVSMHKRFRNGIQKMVNWYQTSDAPGRLLSKKGATIVADEYSEDEDTDLVIILVTHGAGCNALIGALTNQPVLIDVGMASLTMAVCKPTPANTPTSTPGATPKLHSQSPLKNLSLSEQYDVMLTANTEHLRSNTSTPTVSRTPSIGGNHSFRERFGSNSSSSLDAISARSITGSPTSNFGSMRRASSIASSAPRSYAPATHGSIGLWSAPRPEEEASEGADIDDMILNFGNDETASPQPEEDKRPVPETEINQDENLEDDIVAPLGLWGSPKPPGYAEKIREIAPKRRWTAGDRV